MNIDKQIRKLARSVYWQNIYKSAKEIGSIQLFENQTNFSGLQSLFLFWLSIYDSLYHDLAQKEWKYLDEKVIDNDIRCDAFLYFRSQMREQQIDNYKRDEQVSKLKLKDKSNVSTFNVDFQGGN
jgi:hypothetical protein